VEVAGMEWVLAVVGSLAAALAGAYALYVHRQGDCDVVLEVDKVREFALRLEGEGAVVSCLVPLRNRGRQDGMVVELLVEASHPGHVPGRPKIIPFVHVAGAEDEDEGWYWKARLLRSGESVTLRLGATLTFRRRQPDEDLVSLLSRLPGVNLRVHTKSIGRRSITWRLSELALPLEGLLRRTAA